jgi:phage virion morphogenesis protein
MAGIEITIELDSAELEAALNRAIEAGSDMRQPMGEISEEWLALARQRFADEKDPWGVPWAKRWGETGKDENGDPSRKVLHLSGDLERAVQPNSGDDFAEVGVNISGGPGKYAAIHNFGGVIKPKAGKKALSFGGRVVSQVVMPKRQYLGFGPDEQATVEDVMGDWLRGLFAGAAA